MKIDHTPEQLAPDFATLGKWISLTPPYLGDGFNSGRIVSGGIRNVLAEKATRGCTYEDLYGPTKTAEVAKSPFELDPEFSAKEAIDRLVQVDPRYGKLFSLADHDGRAAVAEGKEVSDARKEAAEALDIYKNIETDPNQGPVTPEHTRSLNTISDAVAKVGRPSDMTLFLIDKAVAAQDIKSSLADLVASHERLLLYSGGKLVPDGKVKPDTVVLNLAAAEAYRMTNSVDVLQRVTTAVEQESAHQNREQSLIVSEHAKIKGRENDIRTREDEIRDIRDELKDSNNASEKTRLRDERASLRDEIKDLQIADNDSRTTVEEAKRRASQQSAKKRLHEQYTTVIGDMISRVEDTQQRFDNSIIKARGDYNEALKNAPSYIERQKVSFWVRLGALAFIRRGDKVEHDETVPRLMPKKKYRAVTMGDQARTPARDIAWSIRKTLAAGFVAVELVSLTPLYDTATVPRTAAAVIGEVLTPGFDMPFTGDSGGDQQQPATTTTAANGSSPPTTAEGGTSIPATETEAEITEGTCDNLSSFGAVKGCEDDTPATTTTTTNG